MCRRMSTACVEIRVQRFRGGKWGGGGGIGPPYLQRVLAGARDIVGVYEMVYME